ncbi:phosphoribosyltransferase [Defluviimonas salinarum]|uniref:Phosphoribosyltransferase n=1 Tax=Defluviimonas salinarum TaxID=2992147 RepID=A0ABT3JAK1_9RHOB|nr:phosphoribosyltransferase [Defluviimonas salinarum]MCW3784709.1 phosphoribosyltransferase [Defluviimonas salinarum]
MKGMNGYRIVPMYRRMFFRRAKEIIETISEDLVADFVMPVPSSYGFCNEFSLLLSEWLGIQHIVPDFLGKRTIGGILENGIVEPQAIENKRTRTLYASQLAAWRKMDADQHIAMKELDPKIRPLFQPLEVMSDVSHIAGANILIVDDLMSTGTSIRSASEALRARGVRADKGVCFLSGL